MNDYERERESERQEELVRAQEAVEVARSERDEAREDVATLAEALRQAYNLLGAGAGAATELEHRIVNVHRSASWDAKALAQGLGYGAAAARQALEKVEVAR